MNDLYLISSFFLVLGLLFGSLITWLLTRLKYANYRSEASIREKYVLKEVHSALQVQADMYREDLMEKENELRQLGGDLSSKEQIILNQEEKLRTQKQEFYNLQQRSKIEFENIANRLLEEKSQQFTTQNQQQISHILQPLREKIRDFENNINQKFSEDAKDKASLKTEIEHLKALNQQLSTDAGNLVTALRGDSKIQGDWGEFQLEMLLQKAGLVKNIHYLTQTTYRDEQGRQKRPDFIIHLPNEKHLIIDSKVSLKAYEQFFNCQNTEEKTRYLKAHLDSLRKHIRELASKNYQLLYQINSPDYLLLFVPIEPAFALANQEDSQLFMDALDKNIVVVTSSTLLATMRTVSYIWKQEKQKRSVIEIARQSGLLYDKFVNFVEDLKQIGLKLEHAKDAYANAMNKLVDSRKYGSTLVGRAEKIKELGAKTSKNLPQDLLEMADEMKNE